MHRFERQTLSDAKDASDAVDACRGYPEEWGTNARDALREASHHLYNAARKIRKLNEAITELSASPNSNTPESEGE